MARFFRQSPLTFVLLAVLLLLGGFILWNLAAPEQDARVFAIRQEGYPTSLSELDAWYQSVPESRNAASVVIKANAQPGFANASNLNAVLDEKSWTPTRTQLFDAKSKTEVSALLATNQALLNLLHSVIGLTNSRYPIDLTQGMNTLLPDLAKIKSSVRLLTAEALFETSNGDTDKAIPSLRAAGGVADSAAPEPLLISQLARYASWAIISKRTELILNASHLSDQQLAELQVLVSNAERTDSLARALAGERALHLPVFMSSRDQAFAYAFCGAPWSSPPTTKDRLRASFIMGLLKSTGILHKDKAFYLDIMATNIAAAEAPFPERLTLALQANAAALSPPSRLLIFSRILLPSFAKAFQRDAEHTARIRTSKTVIAVERFRLAHSGNLPATLSDLVPAYLSSVPSDPFDGQPLRYKRLAPGYVVYSIGSDMRDDGGIEGDPNKPTSASDITFTIQR
jgi:hypothetical protein